MNLSVSNLAWPAEDLAPMLAALQEIGIDAVEIAPTAVWPSAPAVSSREVGDLRGLLADHGLQVSGLQSLLYGHPEFQLMDRSCWNDMSTHLRAVIALAGELQAGVAVFGSPKNRLRGARSEAQADEMAAEFFAGLIPDLQAAGVVLALEPNAPAYGADYLTHYADTVRLADLVGSPWVGPQVDTGCLTLVADDPAAAVQHRTPVHVHVSVPQLGAPPGEIDHEAVASNLRAIPYEGWVVLEMLAQPNPRETAIASARWLAETYGDPL